MTSDFCVRPAREVYRRPFRVGRRSMREKPGRKGIYLREQLGPYKRIYSAHVTNLSLLFPLFFVLIYPSVDLVELSTIRRPVARKSELTLQSQTSYPIDELWQKVRSSNFAI